MASPQLWCGGPANVFVGLGSGKSPLYLGTTESAPNFQIKSYFNPVKNDWAGDQQPFDMQYIGQTGLVTGDFTRFNNVLWQQMLSRPNGAGTPGFNVAGDLGAFMVQEGWTFPLWLQNPYATLKASMAGLEAGIQFFNAILVGPDSKTLGLRTMKARFTWFCISQFAPTTGNAVSAGLYTFNVSGLPQIT